MVWEERPSAYRFTRSAIKRTVREWGEAIERDFSHRASSAGCLQTNPGGCRSSQSLQVQRHAVEALYHLNKTLDRPGR